MQNLSVVQCIPLFHPPSYEHFAHLAVMFHSPPLLGYSACTRHGVRRLCDGSGVLPGLCFLGSLILLIVIRTHCSIVQIDDHRGTA